MPSNDPRTDVAISSITGLDIDLARSLSDLTSAKQGLRDAADLHAQDQATITANKATIADLKNQLQQQGQTDTGALAGFKLLGFPTNPLMNIETLPNWKHATDHDVKVRPHGTVDWNKASDGWLDSTIHPANDWDNYYHYYDGMGPQAAAVDFWWYAEFMLPTQADYSGCQAFETESEQCINGDTFDTCAWQFPLGGGKPISKFLRFFDKGGGRHWLDSPVPFDPAIMAPGKVVSFLAESSKIDATRIRYDAVTVNGKKYQLSNVIVTMESQTWPGANYFHFSWQQDPVKSSPFRIRVRNMTAGWR